MKYSTINKKLNSLKANKHAEIDIYFERETIYKVFNSNCKKRVILDGSEILEIGFDDYTKNKTIQLIEEDTDCCTKQSIGGYDDVIFYGKKHAKTFGDVLKSILENHGLKCPAEISTL